jgi:hypothetical protein
MSDDEEDGPDPNVRADDGMVSLSLTFRWGVEFDRTRVVLGMRRSVVSPRKLFNIWWSRDLLCKPACCVASLDDMLLQFPLGTLFIAFNRCCPPGGLLW